MKKINFISKNKFTQVQAVFKVPSSRTLEDPLLKHWRSNIVNARENIRIKKPQKY